MTGPADSEAENPDRVVIGKISGIYAVSGMLRVYSYTRPAENIFKYSSWQIGQGNEWDPRELIKGETHGRLLVARLGGIDDREEARALIGKDIAIDRAQLPVLPEGEYYWADLIRMDVVNQDCKYLGKVTAIQETGANDVLIVEGDRRHLIPLLLDHYVKEIDMDTGKIRVDWDPEYS